MHQNHGSPQSRPHRFGVLQENYRVKKICIHVTNALWVLLFDSQNWIQFFFLQNTYRCCCFFAQNRMVFNIFDVDSWWLNCRRLCTQYMLITTMWMRCCCNYRSIYTIFNDKLQSIESNRCLRHRRCSPHTHCHQFRMQHFFRRKKYKIKLAAAIFW